MTLPVQNPLGHGFPHLSPMAVGAQREMQFVNTARARIENEVSQDWDICKKRVRVCLLPKRTKRVLHEFVLFYQAVGYFLVTSSKLLDLGYD